MCYIFVISVSKTRENKKQKKIGHFAECKSHSTRQSDHTWPTGNNLCRVQKLLHSAKVQTLPSASCQTLGKNSNIYRVPHGSTRQTLNFGRVSFRLALRKIAVIVTPRPKKGTQQSPLRRHRVYRLGFAECYTRQTLCRV